MEAQLTYIALGKIKASILAAIRSIIDRLKYIGGWIVYGMLK